MNRSFCPRNLPLPALLLALSLLPFLEADAQLRRPGFVTVKREDRSQSNLVKEDGAIYLEEMLEKEVPVRIALAAPAYSTLQADRFLGNMLPNQNGVLLAVSDKAYRVRGKAKQGQIAGWITKSAVQGLDPEFETNLRKCYERYLIVKDLIEKNQVALGMTVDEVIASIGPPDKRGSKVTQEGRTDSLEYISYERVPQTVTTRDALGRLVPVTQYVEVESGRVVIDFIDNTVTSIEESEGVDFGKGGVIVPPPVLFY